MGTIYLEGICYSSGGGGGGASSADQVSLDDTNLAYEADDVQEAFEKVTKSLTYAEYQELTEEEKNNGTIYLITDVNGDGQSFQPVIYSEEEHEIGVWINGKPLYEKTFIKTITCGSEQTLLDTTDLQDVDVIVDIFGNYGVIKLEHYDSLNYRSYITIAGTVVIGYVKWGNTSSITAKVTIQYTKTTDVAGSGTWTPQGVPAHHYSTDEQVVGTWIDGKTIYEKSYEFENAISVLANAYSVLVSDVGINIDTLISGESAPSKTATFAPISLQYINGDIEGYYPTAWSIKYLTIRYTKSST